MGAPVGPPKCKGPKQICFVHPTLEELGKKLCKAKMVMRRNLTSHLLRQRSHNLIKIKIGEKLRVP